jgi:hypothetical protein
MKIQENNTGLESRIMRYLKATLEKDLVYGTKNNGLEGFCDSDWAGVGILVMVDFESGPHEGR